MWSGFWVELLADIAVLHEIHSITLLLWPCFSFFEFDWFNRVYPSSILIACGLFEAPIDVVATLRIVYVCRHFSPQWNWPVVRILFNGSRFRWSRFFGNVTWQVLRRNLRDIFSAQTVVMVYVRAWFVLVGALLNILAEDLHRRDLCPQWNPPPRLWAFKFIAKSSFFLPSYHYYYSYDSTV